MIVVDASIVVEVVLRSDKGMALEDAAYLALAETLGASLATRDKALASVAGHRARVELA